MSSAEERQARAQEAIASYLKQLMPIFRTISVQLAEYARLVEKNEKYALEQLNEHIAPEGYEFKKEGE